VVSYAQQDSKKPVRLSAEVKKQISRSQPKELRLGNPDDDRAF
jgi:hypothetical protein